MTEATSLNIRDGSISLSVFVSAHVDNRTQDSLSSSGECNIRVKEHRGSYFGNRIFSCPY